MKPCVAVLGGSGPIGAAVVEQLLASAAWSELQLVLAPGKPALQTGLRGLRALPLDAVRAATVVVVLDAPPAQSLRGPRYARGLREAVIFAPPREQLATLARQLCAQGARTLVVVAPADEASVPASVRAGLIERGEHALLSLPVERLLIIRPSRARAAAARSSPASWRARGEALAGWMLGVLRYMVPKQQRPLPARHVAAFVAQAARLAPQAPPGTYVADAALLWASAQQGDAAAGVRQWLWPERTPAGAQMDALSLKQQ